MRSSWSELVRQLQPPSQTFFLFGPRAVGKSVWLTQHFASRPILSLLDQRLYLELSRDPSLLEAKLGRQEPHAWCCIDEIQKLPSLLDEVQRLITSKKYRFVLTGSSARKLRRGGANLLAGRAVSRHMEGFTALELGERFDLAHALAWGTLPLVWEHPTTAADILTAYVHTYIKEEIKEEGILRKVEPFLRFLEIAGMMNGQILNKKNVASEAFIPRSTVDSYFSILEDTLIGHMLPAYRPQAKVRETAHPKFYWFDHGVARGAAGLLYDPVDAIWQGHALETLIFHELRVYNQISNKHRPIRYYRTGSGQEIDFVIETKKRTSATPSHLVCVEVKSAKRWQRKWERPMRELAASQLHIEKMIGVYCGDEVLHFDDVDVLPIATFLQQLYQDAIF